MKKNYKLEREFISDLFYKGYIAAITEGLNRSDILGIRQSMLTVEFEIKMSKEDLMWEIKLVKKALSEDSCSENKYYKHCLYLGKKTTWHNNPFIPNEFYFIIPENISDGVEKLIKGISLPYGLIIISEKSFTGYIGFEYVIRAKKLHKNKISNNNIMTFLTRSCAESQSLRWEIK